MNVASAYIVARRAVISPVPQPASSTAPAPIGCRAKMAASCGQIASACAARLRTIDSSAICWAWGLLGCMEKSYPPRAP